jgi:hypothetical protein
LVVNGKAVGKYTPDFSYYEAGNYVCEDTKGVKTEAFALRAKLFQALYPDIELRVNGVAAKRPKALKPPKPKFIARKIALRHKRDSKGYSA